MASVSTSAIPQVVRRGLRLPTLWRAGIRANDNERFRMSPLANKGSQRWLQIAVERHPQLLRRVLRESGAVPPRVAVTWTSPLHQDCFNEYRDDTALSKAGIDQLPKVPLHDFWPRRGPVWDATGYTSEGVPLFVEAKAHIPEAATPPSKASEHSKRMIERSLSKARRWYAPRATKPWGELFYQYANRLAHHYFLREVNGVESILVFLYFTHDAEMQGPRSVAEWKGAIRLMHAALGLPADLERFKVFDVFVNVRTLK